jgi:RsiW-degrading membrane proteinase PrsW (M82 family)
MRGKIKCQFISAPALNFTRFTWVLIFAATYTILLSIYFYLRGASRDDANWVIALLVLGQFIFLYRFIFILDFISRSIAAVDLQKPVGSNQYAGYFFCLFFFPIGIWWVNPKIKDLLSQK